MKGSWILQQINKILQQIDKNTKGEVKDIVEKMSWKNYQKEKVMVDLKNTVLMRKLIQDVQYLIKMTSKKGDHIKSKG